MRTAIGCVALLLTTWASAGILPWYSITEMCDRAELIVEGEWLGGERVRVDRVYKGSAHVAAGETIWVRTLDEHKRVVGAWSRSERHELTSTRLVAFLEPADAPGAWRPMGTYEGHALRGGSPGLLWLDAEAVYGYTQAINPGPYWLMPDLRYPREVRTPADLRAEIARGLALHEDWARRTALADPAARATALADFLAEGRSPADCDFYYVRKAGMALSELGAAAVPALMQVLRGPLCQYADHDTMAALGRIGADAAPVVPLLCELLNASPAGPNVPALRALGAIGDLRAAPHVRAWLVPERLATFKACQIGEVGESLCAMGDRDSFDDLVRAIRTLLPMIAEAVGDDESARYCAADLARGLLKLDRPRAEPIVRALINDPRLGAARTMLQYALEEE